MKPAPFDYHAPTATEEALDLIDVHGWDAKILAGGQSLVPTMNFRLAQPAVLVDLNRIDELAYVRPTDGGGLAIGAMTRQAALERSAEVAERAPLLAAALPHIAHPQIRNRGTIGGSIAHADPAAELPAIAVALGATLTIRSRAGERRVEATDFFRGLFATALAPTDLLTEIEVPALPAGAGWSFREIARRHGDYALVGVAAVVRVVEGVCEDVRLVLLSVGGGPVVASSAIDSLLGGAPDAAAIAQAARVAASDDIDPVADLHASATYRRHLAEVLCRRALTEAVGRVGAGS